MFNYYCTQCIGYVDGILLLHATKHFSQKYKITVKKREWRWLWLIVVVMVDLLHVGGE